MIYRDPPCFARAGLRTCADCSSQRPFPWPKCCADASHTPRGVGTSATSIVLRRRRSSAAAAADCRSPNRNCRCSNWASLRSTCCRTRCCPTAAKWHPRARNPSTNWKVNTFSFLVRKETMLSIFQYFLSI